MQYRVQKHYIGRDGFRIHQGWIVVKIIDNTPMAGPFRLKEAAIKEASFLDKVTKPERDKS